MTFTNIDSVHRSSGAEWWQLQGTVYCGVYRHVYWEVPVQMYKQINPILNKISQDINK